MDEQKKPTVFDLYRTEGPWSVKDSHDREVSGYFLKPTYRQRQEVDAYYRDIRAQQKVSSEYANEEKTLSGLSIDELAEKILDIAESMFAANSYYLIGLTENDAKEHDLTREKLLSLYREHKLPELLDMGISRLRELAAMMIVDFRHIMVAMERFYVRSLVYVTYDSDGNRIFSENEDDDNYVENAHPDVLTELLDQFQAFITTEKDEFQASLAGDLNFLPHIVLQRSISDFPGRTEQTS